MALRSFLSGGPLFCWEPAKLTGCPDSQDASLRRPRPDEDRIQKITEFPGTINKILRDASAGMTSVPQGADLCPFCEPSHRLRRHGTYQRTAVTADEVFCICIRRLLCAATGQTVSLLPDFLLPCKQHVIRAIAAFFEAFACRGLSLAAAMSLATIVYPSRQKGTYWIRCLTANMPVIQSYMASIRPRQAAPESKKARRADPDGGFIARARGRLVSLLDLLRKGFRSLEDAFRFHSRTLYARFTKALL